MKVLIGNFKGPKGDTGSKGDKGNKGDTGEAGQRGSRWTSGTSITGTGTVGTKFPNSGITDAQLYDYYVNTATGNLYECKVAGAADVAEWAYIGSFKGPKGDTGPAGSISNINSQKPTYSEAAELKNIDSGETVQVSFGKLKKAVSVLISHYMQKATQSILGHVKLSNSSAITTAGEYALDAIEKNASVAGTLANMLGQVNSNLPSFRKIPLTLLTENVNGYGNTGPMIDCVIYGNICIISFHFGIKDDLGAWEIRNIANGVPRPYGISCPYICNPLDLGNGGEFIPQITVDYNGHLQAITGEHPYISGDNWLIGTLIYFIQT